jgi:Zn-dependent protease with chaperone function
MAKMTREQFAALVRRFEEQAERNPSGYRTRVGLFAALGYGFILLLLLFTLAVIGLLVILLIKGVVNAAILKFLVIFGALALIVLRALWVTFDRPEGIPLTRDIAPRVFETVDRMTDELQAPRFHHILLTDDFNAGVTQCPRFGVFGWPVNYLCLGLPLMQALSPEQFEAILAHELGHQRGGHGRFGGWIYRVAATWSRLLAQIENGASSGNIIYLFFRWYAPKFEAYSFALRRADEYEADACAARLTSPRTAADALCMLPVQGQKLSEGYWGPLFKSVTQQSTPPANPYSGLMSFLRDGTGIGHAPSDAGGLATATVPAVSPERALAEAMREETGHTDTHPALRDRLRALKQEPRLPEPPVETAAAHFLGASLPQFTAELDRQWRENVEPVWRAKHEAAQQQKALLADLKAERGEMLTTEERWRRADWTEDFVGEEAALPLFQELTDDPELGIGANLAMGRILIQRDDPEGIRYLEAARQRDGRLTLPILGLLHDYYRRIGEDARAKAIYAEGMRHADKEDDAAAERAAVGNSKTRYLPHELPAETVAQLRAALAEIGDVAEVFVVRKEVQHFPERPLYIVGFTLTHMWRRTNATKDYQAVSEPMVNLLTSVVPPGAEFLVVPLNVSEFQWLTKRMKKVPDALVYKKSR